MTVNVYVELRYKSGVRALTFSRWMELDFVPHPGMRLFFSRKGIVAAGLDWDSLNVEVESAGWFEESDGEPEHIYVAAKPVDGCPPGDDKSAVLQDVQWMELQGFKVEGHLENALARLTHPDGPSASPDAR